MNRYLLGIVVAIAASQWVGLDPLWAALGGVVAYNLLLPFEWRWYGWRYHIPATSVTNRIIVDYYRTAGSLEFEVSSKREWRVWVWTHEKGLRYDDGAR